MYHVSQWAWSGVTWFLASLFLDHRAAWNKAEQTPVFQVCCDEWTLLPATKWGPRLPVAMGVGGTGTCLASGQRCEVQSSHRRRAVPPSFHWDLSLLLLICFCSNISCPNGGTFFSPGPSAGLSIRRRRFCNSSGFSVQEYLPYERKSSVRM